MSELILPTKPQTLEYPSIYGNKSFHVDFTGWQQGKSPIGFWQLHERIRFFVQDPANGGHIARDTQKLLEKLNGILRISGQVSTMKEQYELLLEAAHTMQDLSLNNTRLKEQIEVTVTALSNETLALEDSTVVRHTDDGVQSSS